MKIKETRQWSMEDVRRECVENNWYTKGTNKDYEKMLEFVSTKEPTNANMLKLAIDISEHSNFEESIEFVLYCISNHCVKRFYDVTE